MINAAVHPMKLAVVIAPRPVSIFVRVATVVSRPCPTAVRERGVGFYSLVYPRSTCAPVTSGSVIDVSATRPAHVLLSLLVIVVTIAS